jgi:hypothetical protein
VPADNRGADRGLHRTVSFHLDAVAMMIGHHSSISVDHFEFESKNRSVGEHGQRHLSMMQTCKHHRFRHT